MKKSLATLKVKEFKITLFKSEGYIIGVVIKNNRPSEYGYWACNSVKEVIEKIAKKITDLTYEEMIDAYNNLPPENYDLTW